MLPKKVLRKIIFLILVFVVIILFSFRQPSVVSSQTEVFCFPHTTDVHIGKGDYYNNFFIRAVEDFNTIIKAPFVIDTGDIVEDAQSKWTSREYLAKYLEIVNTFQFPNNFRVVSGNHDRTSDYAYFLANIGSEKIVFDYGGYRFIGFETTTEPDLAWVESQLQGFEGKAILFGHWPLLVPTGWNLENKLMNINWRYKIMQLIKDYQVLAFVSGHTHEPAVVYNSQYSVLNLGGPSTTRKKSYHLICFDNGQVSVNKIAIGQSPAVLITSPEQHFSGSERGKVGGVVKIRAKVFSDRAISGVSYRVDSGTWQAMRRVDDSLYEADWDATGLSLDQYTLEAQVIDSASRTANHQITVQVIQAGSISPTPSPLPTPTPGPILGDFNDDRKVNIADYVILVDKYQNRDPAADLNQDGTIDDRDYQLFINHYGL